MSEGDVEYKERKEKDEGCKEREKGERKGKRNINKEKVKGRQSGRNR